MNARYWEHIAIQELAQTEGRNTDIINSSASRGIISVTSLGCNTARLTAIDVHLLI